MASKYLKGSCQECGGHVEYPAEMVGTTIDCPHCGKPTELHLASPPQESHLPLRSIVWSVVALIILGLGLLGAMTALHRVQMRAKAQKLAAQQQELAAAKGSEANTQAEPPADLNDPASKAGFRISPIKIEKAAGTSLVYAVGVLKNPSDKQRFGVKLKFDLFDNGDQKVGSATDYQQVIEPKSEWNFKALVVEAKATTAKLTSITEQQ